MSVINNTLSEINDRIVFAMDYPVSSIDSITGFSEGVQGETATRFFIREFRYSLDAINFTDWIPLNNANLTAIPISPTFNFQVEYRYTRKGVDDTGILTFNWVRIDFLTTVDCDMNSNYYFDQSIYKTFFECAEDEDIKKWCIAVLRKLYFPGILPLSMERNQNHNKNEEDRDFIALWTTVCCIFSLIVNYARSFEKLNDSIILLSRYLQDQDIILRGNESLDQLRFIANNFYSEMRRRGTLSISQQAIGTRLVDGELLRLLQYDNRCDEFIFERFPLIWRLDSQSPLYRGIGGRLTNKGYQSKPEIDLSEYPLIDSSKVELIDESGEQVIKITGVSDGSKAGIGFVDPLNPTSQELDKLFNIDPTLNYELRFMMRGDAPVSVGVYGFNASNAPTNPDTISPAFTSNFAILKQKIAIPGEWYDVRVIIFNFTQPSSLNPTILRTNIGVGNNLKMPNSICKAAFEITLDGTDPINNEPTVSDNVVLASVPAGRVLTVADFTLDFSDIEGDVFGGVEINGITTPNVNGELVLNGTPITTFPVTVSPSQLAAGQLVFTDTTSLALYDFDIEFTVLDNQPITIAPLNELYLKNIRLKVLERAYDALPLNGASMIETWVKNRSGQENDIIDEKIKNTLLPYSVFNYNNYL